jgi:hypothetical protein
MAAPLAPVAAPAGVDAATARDLGAALSARGHPVAAATRIDVTGPRDAAETFRLLV